MITAVLLANAGVAPEVIAEDYAESVVAMAGAQANSATADRQATWGSVEVDASLVTACPLVVDFAAGIDRYLSQAGVQRVERDRLRSLLLAD